MQQRCIYTRPHYNRSHYTPPHYSPPRRGSPPPRRGGNDGDRGRPVGPYNVVLLVQNIPLDCRPEELRVPFERFGLVKYVEIPVDLYTGEPRNFAFLEFYDAYAASEAQYHMNGETFAGREITVVLAMDTRPPDDVHPETKLAKADEHDYEEPESKRPEDDMHRETRLSMITRNRRASPWRASRSRSRSAYISPRL